MSTDAPGSTARVDNQDPALFGPTPSQTIGPFFHYGLPWHGGADLVGASPMGARPDLFAGRPAVLDLASPAGRPAGTPIAISGRVLDAERAPVIDAMLETWQANAAGRYASLRDDRDDPPVDPAFAGFGRAAIDADGRYRLRTIRPGRVPAPGGGWQAPHIAVGIFGRGLLRRLFTRLYLPDGDGLADDPVLALVPPERRATLIAAGDATTGYRFDIVLAGAGETVFFAL